MKWLVRLLLLALIAGAGIWSWRHFFPDPEKAIRKQLLALAECATVNANDGPLVRMATAQKLADYFTKDAKAIIDIPPFRQQTFDGRDEIAEQAVFIQSRIKAIRVEFLDLNLTLGLDKKTAQAVLTAKITFPGDDDITAQEMKFLLKQIEGRWLITHVETVKAFN